MSQRGMSLVQRAIKCKSEGQEQSTEPTEASAKGRADVEPRDGMTASEKTVLAPSLGTRG